jgi:hypothetical protein
MYRGIKTKFVKVIKCHNGESPMKRLNGWQRIGIVLSAFWFLITAGFAYQYIGFIDPDNLPFLYHFSEFLGLPYLGFIHKAVVIALAGILPIAGGWLLIYGVLGTTRWVAAGFKSGEKSN